MVYFRRAKDSILKKCVLGTFLVAMTKFLVRSSMREEKFRVVQGVNKSHPSWWGRHDGKYSAQVGSSSCSVLTSGWLSVVLTSGRLSVERNGNSGFSPSNFSSSVPPPAFFCPG